MATDACGISASSLRSILESWATDKPKPKVLYTVPVGPLNYSRVGYANLALISFSVLVWVQPHWGYRHFRAAQGGSPAFQGTRLHHPRRQGSSSSFFARFLDTYHFPSDDPYYYLYYGNDTRYPSYFALELEEPEVGRVLRFDSLSKIMSAGIRIGFASGPETLLQAIDRHVRDPFLLVFFLMVVTRLSHPRKSFLLFSSNIHAN